MNAQEYQELAMRTDPSDYSEIIKRLQSKEVAHLLHSAIGLATEAGEILDMLKKHIYYGKTLDRKNMKEELGDSLWYIAKGSEALNIEMGVLFVFNIEKLKKRFPEGFTKEKALNRDTKRELSHINE